MSLRTSADEAALLLLELARQRSEDVGRETTRFMVRAVTIRKLSNRSLLRYTFLEELADSVFERGWMMFSLGDRFGLVRTSGVQSWPYIASKRIGPLLKRIGGSAAARQQAFQELDKKFPVIQTDEESDD